jgi:hypothetical protein
MRIATVHLLLDVDSDAEACDFCSETFADMPYVVDWAHVRPAHDPLNDESTAHYVQSGEYAEGDFLIAASSLS